MGNIYHEVLTRHQRKLKDKGISWTPRIHHFRLCKELFETEEGFIPPTVDDVIAHQDNYFREEYWRVVKWDFAKFCEYFDRFAPVEEKPHEEKPQYCVNCFSEHKKSDPCRDLKPASEQAVREALEAIKELGEHWKIK